MIKSSKCEHCSKWKHSMLKSLDSDELRSISERKTVAHIKKGDTIFEEGDMLSGVYCIHEGVCKLSKLSANGKSQIVRFVTQGEILGQNSVIGRQPVNLTATALTDMEACFIPKEEILQSFASNPNFSADIIQDVCNELKKADDAIVDLAQKTVKQRLANSLLFLEDTFGKDTEGQINIQLSREEIGNMIGSATESLIRMLSDFNKNGWIETQGKRIKIVNRKQLQKTAEGM